MGQPVGQMTVVAKTIISWLYPRNNNLYGPDMDFADRGCTAEGPDLGRARKPYYQGPQNPYRGRKGFIIYLMEQLKYIVKYYLAYFWRQKAAILKIRHYLGHDIEKASGV